MFTLPKIQKNKTFVELKCVTWSKDSHGLFDYESKSIETSKYKIINNSQVIRNDKQEIEILENDDLLKDKEQQNQLLTEIKLDYENYYIRPNNKSRDQEYLFNDPTRLEDRSQEKETFLIVRSLKDKEGQQKGYKLQLNDILKLGRIEYQVIEIKKNGIVEKIQEQFAKKEFYDYKIDYADKKIYQCRICLVEEEQSEENPFITPCVCKGSCEYVHFECQKYWLKSKIANKVSQSGNLLTFKWKKLECELCQTPLPKEILINSEPSDMVPIQRPDSENYLILESVHRDKKYSKGLYIIQQGNNQEEPNEVLCKMGRGHQCDIRISDISVSRFHSYIKFQNDDFYAFDNNSKFGTLIKMKDQYQITDSKIAVQIGRTVITFINKQEKMQIPELPLNNLQKEQIIQKQKQQQLYTQMTDQLSQYQSIKGQQQINLKNQIYNVGPNVRSSLQQTTFSSNPIEPPVLMASQIQKNNNIKNNGSSNGSLSTTGTSKNYKNYGNKNFINNNNNNNNHQYNPLKSLKSQN